MACIQYSYQSKRRVKRRKGPLSQPPRTRRCHTVELSSMFITNKQSTFPINLSHQPIGSTIRFNLMPFGFLGQSPRQVHERLALRMCCTLFCVRQVRVQINGTGRLAQCATSHTALFLAAKVPHFRPASACTSLKPAFWPE